MTIINVIHKQIILVCPDSKLTGILRFQEHKSGEGLLHIPYSEFKLTPANPTELFLLKEAFNLAKYIIVKSKDPANNLTWEAELTSIKKADFNDIYNVIQNTGFDSKLKYFEVIDISLRCEVIKEGEGYVANTDIFFKTNKICSFTFNLKVTTKDEFTLCIIKPDAVEAGHVAQILSILKDNKLRIAKVQIHGITVSLEKRVHLKKEEVASLYSAHKQKPFFKDLCKFMSSGDCFAAIICGKHAIQVYRQLMGVTNPLHAQEGTIRKLYGTSINNNAVHGSDSLESARNEIECFFPGYYAKYLSHDNNQI